MYKYEKICHSITITATEVSTVATDNTLKMSVTKQYTLCNLLIVIADCCIGFSCIFWT